MDMRGDSDSSEESDCLEEFKCLMHIETVKNEQNKLFTITRWRKFKECCSEWLKTGETRERKIASDLNNTKWLNTDFNDIPKHFGFHNTCYMRFTNKVFIERAMKRKLKEEDSGEASGCTDNTFNKPSPKKLRSTHSFQCSGPVLPALCIVCKKKNKTRSGSRKLDKLMQAETMDGGNFLNYILLSEICFLLTN